MFVKFRTTGKSDAENNDGRVFVVRQAVRKTQRSEWIFENSIETIWRVAQRHITVVLSVRHN